MKTNTYRDNNETNSFKAYIKEITDIEVLSPEEERDLFQRMIEGDKEAKELLIKQGLIAAKPYVAPRPKQMPPAKKEVPAEEAPAEATEQPAE